MGYGEGETLFNAFPLFHVNARYTSVLPAMLLDGGLARAPRPLLGLALLGHLPRRGHHRVQLHGRDGDDARTSSRSGPTTPTTPCAARTAPPRRSRSRSASRSGSGWSSSRCTARPSSAAPSRTSSACRTRAARAGDASLALRGRDPRRARAPLPPARRGRDRRAAAASRTSWSRSTSGDPEATLEAFRGLWFHTGDRGRKDADGWFFFADRLKDAIRRRGENISSWELEQVLNDHEAVEETAVVGVPSELTEEEVLAVVKLKPGEALAPRGAPRLRAGPRAALRGATLRAVRRRAAEEPRAADREARAPRGGRHRRTRGTVSTHGYVVRR